MTHSQSNATGGTEERGFLARLLGGLMGRFRRLFRKNSADNPNIYPFF